MRESLPRKHQSIGAAEFDNFLTNIGVAVAHQVWLRTNLLRLDVRGWVSILRTLQEATENFRVSLRALGSHQSLLDFVEASVPTARPDKTDGKLDPNGMMALADAISASLTESSRIAAKLSPKTLEANLSTLSMGVALALNRLEPVAGTKGAPPDVLGRSFVRELGYAWARATGKPPPRTVITDSSRPGGGPFGRFVLLANTLLPKEFQFQDDILASLAARVSREEAKVFASASGRK